MATTTPPAALLATLVAADPGRPRITVYDDTDTPTRGERIELSARVLANWVAKAANLLQDELEAAPGTTVRLDLPPHWRTLYWAFAVWSVGAVVVLPGAAGNGGTPDVLVTDDPEAAAAATDAERVVLVTLAGLARTATGLVPPGAVDEARELATHGDVFEPYDLPSDAGEALRTVDGPIPYGRLVPEVGAGGRVHLTARDPGAFLRTALEVYRGDGSLVLTRGTPDADVLAARLTSEGVTRSA